MADDQHAAGELQQRLLQRAQCIDVEIVGWLVEEQQVAAALEELREVDTVPLPAGEPPDLLLLVGALEAKGAQVGAGLHLAVAELDLVLPLRDLLEHGVLRLQRLPRLIDIGQADGGADPDAAAVRLLFADQHLEQRRLTGAVWPDDADDATGRQPEGEVLDQQVFVIALAQLLHLHDHVAQPFGERDADLGPVVSPLLVLVNQGVEGLDPGLALGLLGARRRADPVQLLTERPLARRLGLLLAGEARLLLVQPAGVVALEREAAAVIELQDPPGYVVEEVAVMRHEHDRPRVLL